MLRARSDDAKDQRRQALLDAALDEFFEKGFAATRMVDVARRAGLSKGALYLYFDSKEAMFKALIESLTSPKLEQLEQIADGAASIEQALAGLSAFAPAMIRQSDMPRLMKVVIGDSHLFPEIVQAYRVELIERVIGLVAGVLERAEARGEIEIDDPLLTARLVMAPIVLSGVWQAMFGRDPKAAIDLERLFRIHGELMLKALKPRGAS